MSTSHLVHSHTLVAGEFAQSLDVDGHPLRADVSVEEGGHASAPGPHDLFDASLAACMTLTAHWYAKHKSLPLERVRCTIERDDKDERAKPAVYRLRVRVAFEGALTDEQRAALARAVEHCPVSKLMTQTEVQIATTVVTDGSA